jgi:predicted amidophosphoribosyltransferase
MKAPRSVALSACPHGQARISGGKFCSECGKPLAAARAFCTQCGTELAPQGRFCSECGTARGA